MNFFDGSLHPENQQKLGITAAPYGPEWLPSDFPEDIAVTMEAQIQKAVDCYNAGATVLHVHAREPDGKGSKRLSKYNELLAGIRARAPGLILQVGGSISFAPESEGEVARWLSDDTRHMLAELQPAPDQVTIAINTNQMNVVEQMCPADLEGTRGRPRRRPGVRARPPEHRAWTAGAARLAGAHDRLRMIRVNQSRADSHDSTSGAYDASESVARGQPRFDPGRGAGGRMRASHLRADSHDSTSARSPAKRSPAAV
ncbi:3-keto-5-aminohexanoate cleavage protein [Nannocystis pusilla]|uniref:3-keto-5-aminohexanoate cleavage protein n=1 Tax=Nannocystis pusilla TaxID=889268 RepID=A0ABS7TRB1_9BACT|nr:3-keto-5-aminohexanoate cleavage protein [Nannocystis pusilla]MBZ5710767.1 3-keto-5-aminohexanoate cleavage protein [Nannocystis pusilla]